MIRATAAWAIGRLGRKEQKKWIETLEVVDQKEDNEEVSIEIAQAITMLQKKNKEKRPNS